jgi:hypothetical protein
LIAKLSSQTFRLFVDFDLSSPALLLLVSALSFFLLEEFPRLLGLLLIGFSLRSTSYFFLALALPFFSLDLGFQSCCLGIDIPLHSGVWLLCGLGSNMQRRE